jgi:hypothetical protein
MVAAEGVLKGVTYPFCLDFGAGVENDDMMLQFSRADSQREENNTPDSTQIVFPSLAVMGMSYNDCRFLRSFPFFSVIQ